MPDERTQRIAADENRFRRINDDLRIDLAKLPREPDVVPFVCECGRGTCTLIVGLTVAQYESVRANSRRFIVVAGHEIPDTEVVVAHVAGCAVVEKLPASASLVDAADPRRD